MKVIGTKKPSMEAIKKVVNVEGSKSGKMKKLFEMGLEVKEISTIMGVRYNFVYNVISNWVNINEIEVEKNSKESKKDEIIRLFKEGKTNIEISKILKTNYNYVYKVIKELPKVKVQTK